MALEQIDLKLSEEVGSLQESVSEYAPDSGKTVRVAKFIGDAQRQESVVKLIWKYGAQDEQLIWTVSSSGDQMPFVYSPPELEVDGVNKLALVLENNELSAQYMSGYALVEVE